MSQYGHKIPSGIGFRRGDSDKRFVVGLDTGSKSFVQQQFAEECDINFLMKKYLQNGVIAHVNKYEGRFEDVTEVTDFHDAQNQIAAAQRMFDDLPSSIRERFDNDPGKFLAFATDNANEDELVKMGLARARQKPGDVIETPPPERPPAPVKPA